MPDTSKPAEPDSIRPRKTKRHGRQAEPVATPTLPADAEVDENGFAALLDRLAALKPLKEVFLVGAGDGRGRWVQLLRQWKPAHATLAEADSKQLARLRQTIAGMSAQWRVLEDVVGQDAGEVSFFLASNPAENGLLQPEDLRVLWQNLTQVGRQSRQSIALKQLRRDEADTGRCWLIIDCLPALPVIRGYGALGDVDVVVARVVLGAGTQLASVTAEAGLAETAAYLKESGFRKVAVLPGRHPSIAHALFVADTRDDSWKTDEKPAPTTASARKESSGVSTLSVEDLKGNAGHDSEEHGAQPLPAVRAATSSGGEAQSKNVKNRDQGLAAKSPSAGKASKAEVADKNPNIGKDSREELATLATSNKELAQATAKDSPQRPRPELFVGTRKDPATTDYSQFDQIFQWEKTGWTALITTWKRTAYLEEQLNAIAKQSVPPTAIILLQNESHIEIDRALLDRFGAKLIRSDINSLYTRWVMGYLADTRYICVFDDDVIPGAKWIENCIRASDENNALVGPSGRIANPGNSPAWINVDPSYNNHLNIYVSCAERDVFCDWVCNSYFFRTDWVKYIVSAQRYMGTHETFDDIQLATTLLRFGRIRTVVAKQPSDDVAWHGNIKRGYGSDELAMWRRHEQHFDRRSKLIKDIDDAGFSWASRAKITPPHKNPQKK